MAPKRSTGLDVILTRIGSWSNSIRISTRTGDSSNSGGKSRDHDGSDIEAHSESEVGISQKTDVKRVLCILFLQFEG